MTAVVKILEKTDNTNYTQDKILVLRKSIDNVKDAQLGFMPLFIDDLEGIRSKILKLKGGDFMGIEEAIHDTRKRSIDIIDSQKHTESHIDYCDALMEAKKNNGIATSEDLQNMENKDWVTIFSVANKDDVEMNLAEANVVIPEGVVNITNKAFMRSSLLKLTIPWNVRTIGISAFAECGSLTSATILHGIETIGKRAFYRCDALASIIIPGSVESIGEQAFAECGSLTSATILHGIKTIGKRAFYRCDALTSVVIPGSVDSIGEEAFADCCSLTSATMHHGIKTIGKRAFYRCDALASISIPGSVESIGEQAFMRCKLKLVKIPGSVKSIEKYAFDTCGHLTDLTILDGVQSIGQDAFAMCIALTSVIIPGSVTVIGPGAFRECSALTDLTILDGVQSIDEEAFAGCKALKSVIIPKSVTKIENNAFKGCIEYSIPLRLAKLHGIIHHSVLVASGENLVNQPTTVVCIGELHGDQVCGDNDYISAYKNMLDHNEKAKNPVNLDVFLETGNWNLPTHVRNE